MSKIDFATKEAPQQAAEATKALVPRPANTSVTSYRPVLGDYIPSLAETRLPRISIVHGVGRLKEDFPVGGIVYGGQVLLYEARLGKKEASDPFEMVVLGWLPMRYVEKVRGGGRGMIVTSEEAVVEANGTLDYNEWVEKRAQGVRRFETLAEAVCLVKQPKMCENEPAQFPLIIEGERWALGIWGMKGTAFTNGAKTIFSSRHTGCCVDGYPACSWMASTESKPYTTEEGGQTDIPIPKFVPGKITTQKFCDYAVNLVTKGAAAAMHESKSAED